MGRFDGDPAGPPTGEALAPAKRFHQDGAQSSNGRGRSLIGNQYFQDGRGRPSLHRNRSKDESRYPASVQIPIGTYSSSGSTCAGRALPIKACGRKPEHDVPKAQSAPCWQHPGIYPGEDQCK
jgi:hypothetical protein